MQNSRKQQSKSFQKTIKFLEKGNRFLEKGSIRSCKRKIIINKLEHCENQTSKQKLFLCAYLLEK